MLRLHTRKRSKSDNYINKKFVHKIHQYVYLFSFETVQGDLFLAAEPVWLHRVVAVVVCHSRGQILHALQYLTAVAVTGETHIAKVVLDKEIWLDFGLQCGVVPEILPFGLQTIGCYSIRYFFPSRIKSPFCGAPFN